MVAGQIKGTRQCTAGLQRARQRSAQAEFRCLVGVDETVLIRRQSRVDGHLRGRLARDVMAGLDSDFGTGNGCYEAVTGDDDRLGDISPRNLRQGGGQSPTL